MNSHIRLLDLLAGWAAYTSERTYVDEAEYSPPYSEAVHKLYQDCGKFDDLDDSEVVAYVRDWVVPVLRDGK